MKTVSRYTVLAFVAFATLLLDGCANAGPDKTVDAGAIVQLNGEDSTADRGGKIVKYLWKQKKRDKVKVSLKDNPGKKPTFTAPHVKKKTKLHFKLKTYEYYSCKYVKSKPDRLPKGKVYYAKKHQVCKVNTSKDSVTITVRKSNKKILPVAVAEVNQTEIKPGEPVSFTAENSTDENGEIISYIWSENNETLSEDMNFPHTFETTGVHHIKLTVVDEEEQNATDTVDVEVLGDLRKPVARIKTDKKSIKVSENIRFDANESFDPDGEITNYTWKDANNTVLSTEKAFTHSFDLPGKYTITLTVIDEDGQTGEASTVINVEDEHNVSLQSIAISASTQNLEVNETALLTAIGKYDNNTTKDISQDVNWISSDTSLATIENKNILHAIEDGTVQIHASYGDISSSLLTVTIKWPDNTNSGIPTSVTLHGVFNNIGGAESGSHINIYYEDPTTNDYRMVTSTPINDDNTYSVTFTPVANILTYNIGTCRPQATLQLQPGIDDYEVDIDQFDGCGNGSEWNPYY